MNMIVLLTVALVFIIGHYTDKWLRNKYDIRDTFVGVLSWFNKLHIAIDIGIVIVFVFFILQTTYPTNFFLVLAMLFALLAGRLIMYYYYAKSSKEWMLILNQLGMVIALFGLSLLFTLVLEL
ncbi:DUF4181 domain-containing protein [Alkalibacillus haloalkaliphilus]|uniref:DUF4181 domain-containing protein n=1 Tax=Alkalibacillus haloalkaliphilus TaxID=94136 RepID=A0A511WA21_9BACI|nr:DUF4181 domain-containing protein [Alkalibacillus haloalkaliphilus]GEN46182.1 hypothetical protein AHA02nite_19580 [Alkalibacillus haloalkaliphilus]